MPSRVSPGTKKDALEGSVARTTRVRLTLPLEESGDLSVAGDFERRTPGSVLEVGGGAILEEDADAGDISLPGDDVQCRQSFLAPGLAQCVGIGAVLQEQGEQLGLVLEVGGMDEGVPCDLSRRPPSAA